MFFHSVLTTITATQIIISLFIQLAKHLRLQWYVGSLYVWELKKRAESFLLIVETQSPFKSYQVLVLVIHHQNTSCLIWSWWCQLQLHRFQHYLEYLWTRLCESIYFYYIVCQVNSYEYLCIVQRVVKTLHYCRWESTVWKFKNIVCTFFCNTDFPWNQFWQT